MKLFIDNCRLKTKLRNFVKIVSEFIFSWTRELVLFREFVDGRGDVLLANKISDNFGTILLNLDFCTESSNFGLIFQNFAPCGRNILKNRPELSVFSSTQGSVILPPIMAPPKATSGTSGSSAISVSTCVGSAIFFYKLLNFWRYFWQTFELLTKLFPQFQISTMMLWVFASIYWTVLQLICCGGCN